MHDLLERIKWVIIQHKGEDAGLIAEYIVKEIEMTHRIIEPETVSNEMLDACFHALPEHYDLPDPTRRPWHAFKARRRFTAMVLAAPVFSRKDDGNA